MALKNLNAVIQNLNAANVAKQGRDTVNEIVGLRMPTALSHGRPMSPGLATFTPTLKRVGRCSSPSGYPVRPAYWRESVTGAIPVLSRNARPTSMSGRGLSERCERHHLTSGRDYQSHDRRDDQQSTVIGQRPIGSALFTNRGK
jgi:hypothetical protein